jgi:predicted membrane chloride channel (bestrophin family)
MNNNLSEWSVRSINDIFYEIEEVIIHCKRYNDGVDFYAYRLIISDLHVYCTAMQINCLALKQMIDEVDRVNNAEDGLDNHG